MRRQVITAMAVLSLVAAACSGEASGAGGGGGGAPSIEAAKEQAQEFRTLGMPDDWINFGNFFTALCDEYGLGCTGSGGGPNRFDTDMSSAEEIASFKSERSNPGMCADIGIFFGQVAEREGVLIDYLPEAAKELPPQYRSKDGGWVASAVGVISFLVNEDVVTNPPRTWSDLLKPEYKGLISMSDPRTSGTGQATVVSAAAALGHGQIDLDAAFEFFRKLYQMGQINEAEFTNASFERGETPIALRYDFVALQAALPAREKGINATVSVPDDGAVWTPSAIMCNKNTVDPDLAKLTLDFTLSDRGQLVFAEVGARPIRWVLGDLEVPAELQANWLPASEYANVIEWPEDQWPDPAMIAERWESEVLG
jgi:putative spermidine/putrescine transport system substrate-binding protein